MPRVVVLGTGTDVGKTRVTLALKSALQRRAPHSPLLALKPVETGVDPRDPALLAPSSQGQSPSPSDAAVLAGGERGAAQHYRSYVWGISPHLAAARAGDELHLAAIVQWVERQEQAHSLHCHTIQGVSPSSGFRLDDEPSSASTATRDPSTSPIVTLVETAGGTFTPLSYACTNLDLARALEPAVWLLVAPDRLGVLHDVTSTIIAMERHARRPDHVVLTSPPANDLSTGTNANELSQLRLCNVASILPTTGRFPNGPTLDRWLDSLLGRDQEAVATPRPTS